MAPHRKQTRTGQERGRSKTSPAAVTTIPTTSFDDSGAFGASAGRSSEPSRTQAGLTRATEKDDAQPKNRIARAARSVRGAISRLIRRGDHETPIATEPERTLQPSSPKPAARILRRDADIPMDELARVHTPQQTSLKGSFRDDGRDRQNDQEYASGTADTGWNDEDRITNKSGDPRIGTHGRTYEAAERKIDDESK